jgi:hypothetical protein
LHEAELLERASAAWDIDVAKSFSPTHLSVGTELQTWLVNPTLRLWESTITVDTCEANTLKENEYYVPYGVDNERSLEGKKHGHAPIIAPLILHVIYDQLSHVNESANRTVTTIRITGYSECYVNSAGSKLLLMCHPAYSGKRPWNNW